MFWVIFKVMVFCVGFLSRHANGNLFNPHVMPSIGPFFEGWYMRITDPLSRDSIGLLFGSVVPKNNTSRDPKVLTSLLYRKCDDEIGCKLHSCNSEFESNELEIKARGQPVTKDPDVGSDANFLWSATGKNSSLMFLQLNNITAIHYRCNKNVSFDAHFSASFPWSASGYGPAGRLDRVPFLPLHWFVYSLGSHVNEYQLIDLGSRERRRGKGSVHMEKNWGNSFPSAWVWSQGVSETDSGVAYAFSGGPLQFGPLSKTAYLAGFRNLKKNLEIDFRPDNSLVSIDKDGCNGTLDMVFKNIWYDMHVQITAPPTSFSECLFGPMKSGFRPVCYESYDAVTSITIYKKHLFLFKNQVDHVILEGTALEFGGTYACNNKCSL